MQVGPRDSWHSVSFCFRSSESFVVRVGTREKQVSVLRIGLRGRRAGQMPAVLVDLLKFARGGEFRHPAHDRGAAKRVERLRKTLVAWLPITDGSEPLRRVGRCAWEANFTVDYDIRGRGESARDEEDAPGWSGPGD
jgi:hypothetical protein